MIAVLAGVAVVCVFTWWATFRIAERVLRAERTVDDEFDE